MAKCFPRHTSPAHVATPYSPRVSTGTRLGAPDFVVADTGPKLPLIRGPRKARCWLSGVEWVSRTFEGPTTGIHQPLTTRPQFLSGFSCCRHPLLHTGARSHPQI